MVWENTYIKITTEPAGAKIYLNDNYKGLSPLIIRSTPGTERDLKLLKSGYIRRRRLIRWPDEGQLDLDFVLIPESKPEPEPEPEPEPTPPEYPKTISRGDYSFEARNAEEQKQLREFLGLFPPGDDLDTWLSKKDLAGLEEWKSYWFNIFGSLGRSDLLTFVDSKFVEYKLKLAVEIPPEKTWWEKLKERIGEEAEFFEKELDKILGATELNKIVNVIVKLTTGKNVEGEPEEFGSADDWIEMISFAAIVIPGGKIPVTGAKLAISKISAKEAAALTTKFGKKAIINNLIKVVKSHPETSAKFLSKFPQPVREAVISGLYKSPAGRIAIVTLSKMGFFKYLQPWWKGKLAIVGLSVAAAGLFITAVGSYPFAGFIKEEALQTIGFASRTAKDLNDILGLEKAIALQEEILDITTWEKIKGYIPFVNVLTQLDDFYLAAKIKLEEDKVFLAAMKGEEIPVGVITEEEKWKIIGEEAEARREDERIAEEERYAKIIADAEERKRLARIEEAEYYEKIRIEAEERAAARKIEEAEYWAAVQEEARIAEAEKLILAEEYWAKVEADRIARREEEEKYWADKLAGPKEATITITSTPLQADVYIDGEFTWVTTPYTILLPIGEYVVRVQKEGYYAEEKVIEVEEGDVEEIPFTLEEIPPEEKPVEPYIPYQPVYPTGYETLYPAIQAPIFYEEPAAPLEKELLINIETTDLKPWEGRIYSIGIQDLSVPAIEPIILIGNDEEELLTQFLEIFNQINPKKLVGFKLTFDHRYIFAKMMLYRLQNEAFKDIEMLDVKQIMDQVQEKFVYFPSKRGSLDDWGKMLLGKGKYGSQELMLKKYISGDFDYVKAFQLRQLEITKGIYDLSRFVGLESLSTPIQSNPETTYNPSSIIPEETLPFTQTKKCPNCLAEQPIGSETCDICGTKI